MGQSSSILPIDEQRRSALDEAIGRLFNFSESERIHLPVPPGVMLEFKSNSALDREFMDCVRAALASVGHRMGRTFGDPRNPLLVAVRTVAGLQSVKTHYGVLNIGLNDEIVESLIDLTRDTQFVYDCYRRFLMSFCCGVIPGAHRSPIRKSFDRALEMFCQRSGFADATEMSGEDLHLLCDMYKDLIFSHFGLVVPDDPMTQLEMATRAVATGINERRRAHPALCPANCADGLVIQSMVFGNMGHNSGVGLAWSRDPITGIKEDGGMYLSNAQGDDLRYGKRHPRPLCQIELNSCEIARQIRSVRSAFNHHLDTDYTFDFTVEHGKVYVLNYDRMPGKRSYSPANSFSGPVAVETRAA